jgi:hypothetical protein
MRRSPVALEDRTMADPTQALEDLALLVQLCDRMADEGAGSMYHPDTLAQRNAVVRRLREFIEGAVGAALPVALADKALEIAEEIDTLRDSDIRIPSIQLLVGHAMTWALEHKTAAGVAEPGYQVQGEKGTHGS